VQELGVSLVVIHPRSTGLDDRATLKLGYRPGGGFELLDQISEGAYPELSHLLAASKVTVLVGLASMVDDNRLPESVAALVRQKSTGCRILPLNSRANTYGALDMGVAPDLLPGRVAVGSIGCANLAESWGEGVPPRPGRDTRSILEGLVAGEVRGLILVGADPLRDCPDRAVAAEGLEAAEYLISIYAFIHDSNRDADVILPAAAFTEKEGTVTNIEGRVQRVNQLGPGPGQARPDWAILDDIASMMGMGMGLASAETVAKEIATLAPVYEGVSWDLLDWDEREGVVVPVAGVTPLNHIPVSLKGNRAPRAALTLHVAKVMYDDGVRLRHSPSLRRLARGPVAHISPSDAPKIGARDGVKVKLVTKRGEGFFDAVIDPGTPAGVVYVPFNQPGADPLGIDAVVRVTVVK
jgi:predicted molibdopterin-dependent oxidoreductase YjgC